MTSLVKASGLTIAGRLRPTDLTITDPELIAVIGPNGAGKTSLLRALARIEGDKGEVRVGAEDVGRAPPSRRMRLLSFLPATRNLVWPIAARDVIALGLPSPNVARIEELIETFELQELANRPVNHLSTGERTRVLLARALAAEPLLILLDEPLSNLDPYWVLKTLRILHMEIARNRCAILASLHDLGQVGGFNRVLLIDDGSIAADSTPAEMMESPELTAAFRIERAGTGWKISEKPSG
ncbi:MAG: ABC transporter ATP-binding protein [Sphingomonas sp.]|nr:ABC transporter ATP-binding protein [Sphingomonas sp.]